MLILAAITFIDYFLEVAISDPVTYRTSVVFRVMGTQITGLLYLSLLTKKKVYMRYALVATICLWLVQAGALFVAGRFIYRGLVPCIAVFGAYVTFFDIAP